jgi:hypothetical protein
VTTRLFDRIRRGLAPVLAMLCLAASVVVPVIDSIEPDRGPVFESGHDRGACAHGHDHSICTQVAANAGVTTEAGRHGFHETEGPAAPLAFAHAHVPHAEQFPPLGPRAPPLV